MVSIAGHHGGRQGIIQDNVREVGCCRRTMTLNISINLLKYGFKQRKSIFCSVPVAAQTINPGSVEVIAAKDRSFVIKSKGSLTFSTSTVKVLRVCLIETQNIIIVRVLLG